ncbi:MAG: endolytic transglycosylase MltG [Pseudomonadota bacterium]
MRLRYWGSLLLVLLLLSSLVLVWVWRDAERFLQTPLKLPDAGMQLEVAPGTAFRTLARRLVEQGVLENEYYWYVYARQRQMAHRIQAGEYAIAAGTTPGQLLNLLVSGKTVVYELTFVEGSTFRQLMARIHSHPALTQTLSGLEPAAVMEQLGQPGLHPEGQFFPDTYRFPRGTTDLQFLRRAYRRMQSELAQAWADRSDQIAIQSPAEALIMASIVEKETGQASERPTISGVFDRRLRIGMKLQTDPTVIYGMGERFQGNIRRRDLREDTPYNTYVHYGLPPTPICFPGRAALDAAVRPAAGKALYFVAKGDGSHQFSATLREHNAAVRRYQLKK